MKRALATFFAAAVLAGLSGCLHDQVAVNGACGQPAAGADHQRAGDCKDVLLCGWFTRDPCNRPVCPHCGGLHQRACGAHCGHGTGTGQPSGPPVGYITYPYYTLRGPRDFLQRTPSPIGP
jgi:hypothetical protein